MADKPRRRLPDEEVVAVLVQVILEEGTVSSQTRLAQLVNQRLRRRGGRVTPQRVRVLAVKSGLVGLAIRTRHGGETPDMDACPVCLSKLRRTANRTLAGATVATGYKCPRCPWWTGRELRVPQHYTFQAKVARAEEREQVTFVVDRRR